MRTQIGDKLYQYLWRNKVHLPGWSAKVLYGLFRNHRFFILKERNLLNAFFPKIGGYEYSDMFKVGNDWYVKKTFVSRSWPVLDTYEIVNTQPMSGPVDVEFVLKYYYKPVMPLDSIEVEINIDPSEIDGILKGEEVSRREHTRSISQDI